MNDSAMKIGRMPRAGIIAAALVIASINCAALSQARPKSPYDSQDLTDLGAKLVELGMEDILGQLVKEQGAANLRPDQLVLSAQYDMALADTHIDEDRDAKMDEGIAKLEKAVKAAADQAAKADESVARFDKVAKPADKAVAGQAVADREKAQADACEARLALYKYQIMLAKAIGLQKTDPYFSRVKNLLASKQDAAKLSDWAGKAAEILKPLAEDIKGSVESWGDLWKRSYRNMAEAMNAEAGYRLAWIEYYHAVGMKEGTDKDRELTECQNAIETYARPRDPDAATGVKYMALLLSGRCHRELHQYKDAMEDLKAAAAPASDGATRMEAQIEMVRCAIEEARFVNAKDASAGKAKFMAARDAVGDFRKVGDKFHDHVQLARYAFFAAVLENYLYETWASCDQSEEDKKNHADLAEKAKMAWTLKFSAPDEVAWYWKQWSYKSRDVGSPAPGASTTRPAVTGTALLALATTLYAESIPESGQEPSAEQRKKMEDADKLFEQIITSKDETLKSSRCTAMFNRAKLLVRLKKNQEAAELFAQVAKEYKDDAVAGEAALDVVMIWSGVISELSSTGKEIVPKMRQLLVGAINVLLGNHQWAKEDWAKTADIQKYHFDCGFQCQRLADLDPANARSWFKMAVESYEQVPATAPEIIDARFGAIECRFGLMKAMGNAPATGPATQTETGTADIKAQGAELVKLADKFVADCATLASGKDKESAAHLMNLQAAADFIKAKTLCDMLGQEALALRLLADLGAKYPDTTVIHDANVYEIQRLITRGKINGPGGAVEKAKDFSKRFPQSGPYVMGLLITQIRDSIAKLEAVDPHSPTLASLRKDYLDFAKTLYESNKDDNAYRQLYGDALVESAKTDDEKTTQAKADEAIWIFQQCLDGDKKIQDADAKVIDTRIKKMVEDVTGAFNNPQKLDTEAATFFKTMDEEHLKIDDSMDAINVKNCLKKMDDAVKAGDAKGELDARKAIVRDLGDAWQKLGRKLKKDVLIDVASIRGMGRAYTLKKQWGDALKWYRQLNGVDANMGRLCWQIRAEHAQVAFECYKDKPDELKNLRALITQWKMENDEMGGEDLKTIFSTVENQIDTKVPETTGKPPQK